MKNIITAVLFLFSLTLGITLISEHIGKDADAATLKPIGPSQTHAPAATQATSDEVIRSCGQPEKAWITTSGKPQYESDVQHLWYPEVPAEVMLVRTPNDPNEAMRQWTFYGVSPSRTGNGMYKEATLAKRMPCVAQWADVYTDHPL